MGIHNRSFKEKWLALFEKENTSEVLYKKTCYCMIFYFFLSKKFPILLSVWF